MRKAEHYVDPERWPHVVAAPQASMMSHRAAKVQQRMAALLQDRGVGVSSGGDAPWCEISDGETVDRIVADGWLGFGESFMAGLWDAEPLVDVLGVLLEQPWEGGVGAWLGRRKAAQRGRVTDPVAGELPYSLVELFAGATRSSGAALFHSAARSTERNPVVLSKARRGRGEGAMLVDQTWFGEPAAVDRVDLDEAQRRRVSTMLDLAHVGPGDRVLEMPSTGGELAIAAARRGARVDVLTSSVEHADAVWARVRSAGVAGAVEIEVLPGPIPTPRQWNGRYDAIFSVERLETLGQVGMGQYLRAVDRMLDSEGVAVVQTVVATASCRDTAREALDVSRAYIWPALDYPTVPALRDAIGRHTDLRVIAENYLGEHYSATLALWQENFLANHRLAAAAGFDGVFRKLWYFHLALHEAMVRGGDLDCVQVALRRR